MAGGWEDVTAAGSWIGTRAGTGGELNKHGMVCPSAPLSRVPDGLEFSLQGTMLQVAPVLTKYLSIVSSSVRKMSPALARKCIAVVVACAGLATELKMVRRQTSFPTKHRVQHTCEPYWHSNC
jgi:hypothetical protein